MEDIDTMMLRMVSGARGDTIEIMKRNAAADGREIERLRKVESIARAFLSEWDNPTPDYAYRVNLKQQLRDALNRK